MNILFLSHRCADTTIGGLAEFLSFLPTTLKTYGINSIIYTQSDTKKNSALLTLHSLHEDIPHYVGPFLKPRWWVSKKELNPLIELCEKEKIDAVHAQGTYRAGYMAMHLSQHTNIPFVITSHSDIHAVNSKRMQRSNIQKRCRKILQQASFVTHLSPLMEKASDHIFNTQAKSKIIHNGIDYPAWSTMNLSEADYILAIGRLEPEKGFSILIDAYAELIKQGMTTSLVIAGKGSMEAALQSQAKHHHLNVVTKIDEMDAFPARSVIFTGYVKNTQKKSLFCQSKLVLFATQPKKWEEPFGIVLLEAMAAGKSIIASDITTTHYLQTLGLQALLVDPENISSWVQAIHHLLNDKKQREQMGKINKEEAKQFDWYQIAKEYVEIYQKIRVSR